MMRSSRGLARHLQNSGRFSRRIMSRRLQRPVLFLAVIAMSAGLRAADSAASVPKSTPPAPAPAAAAAASASAKQSADAKAAAAATSRDIQAAMEQFNLKREKLLADRGELEKKLKNATEAQKKAILEQIDQQQKELLQEQRALGKRIRDDMRKLRPNIPPPGKG